MDSFLKRLDKSWWFLLTFGVLMLLLIALLIVFFRDNTSITYQGRRLTLVRTGDGNSVTMADSEGELLQWKGYSSGGFAYRGEKVAISFNAPGGGAVFTFSDGSVETLQGRGERGKIADYGGLYISGLTPERKSEVWAVRKLAAMGIYHYSVGRNILAGLFGSLFLLVGCSRLFYPEAWWRMQVSLVVVGGEPTDWAILSGRIFGVMIVAFVFFMICILPMIGPVFFH